MVNWEGPDGSLGRYVAQEVRKTLNSYLAQPNLVAETCQPGKGHCRRRLRLPSDCRTCPEQR